MSQAFNRLYVDVPPDTAVKLKVKAAESGMSQKALLCSLIEDACTEKPKRKTRSKRKK